MYLCAAAAAAEYYWLQEFICYVIPLDERKKPNKIAVLLFHTGDVI